MAVVLIITVTTSLQLARPQPSCSVVFPNGLQTPGDFPDFPWHTTVPDTHWRPPRTHCATCCATLARIPRLLPDRLTWESFLEWKHDKVMIELCMLDPIVKPRPQGHPANPRCGPCQRFKFLTTPTCLSYAPPRVQGFLIHNAVFESAGMQSQHRQDFGETRAPCPRAARPSAKLQAMRFVYDKIATALPRSSSSEPEQDERSGVLNFQSTSALGAISKARFVHSWLQDSPKFADCLAGTTSSDHRAVQAPESSMAPCGCGFYQCCMYCSPQEVAVRDLHRTVYGNKELRRPFAVMAGFSTNDRASKASTTEAPSIARPGLNGLRRRSRHLVVDLPARVVSRLVRQRLLSPALARRAFSIILASWRRGQRTQGAVNSLRVRLNLLLKLRVQSGRVLKAKRLGS